MPVFSDSSENPAYHALHQHQARIGHLGHVAAILGWDEAVMMPSGGGEARAEAMAALRLVMHEMNTAPHLRAQIEEAREGTLSPLSAANLAEMDRQLTKATAIPA